MSTAAQNGDAITEYQTYEDYLDSQITPLDLYYLEVKLHKKTRTQTFLFRIKNWQDN